MIHSGNGGHMFEIYLHMWRISWTEHTQEKRENAISFGQLRVRALLYFEVSFCSTRVLGIAGSRCKLI